MQQRLSVALVLGGALGIGACDGEAPTALGSTATDPAPISAIRFSTSTDYASHRPVLAYAETITDPLSGEAGRVIWLRRDLGNANLAHDFVYGDPRRAAFNGGHPGVTYAVNTGFPSDDANLQDQVGWLQRSVAIWDAADCADLTLRMNSIPPGQRGVIALFLQTGIIPLTWTADVTQVGFLGAGTIFPPGTGTLAVTYTLMWEDRFGNLTDIDGNGKADLALREIYYNDQYEWADNGVDGRQPDGIRYFDFPTVAVHEVGHGFSAAHFGSIGLKDDHLVAEPRAVMNAVYGGVLRELTGRDLGAHCSNWAEWPNN